MEGTKKMNNIVLIDILEYAFLFSKNCIAGIVDNIHFKKSEEKKYCNIISEKIYYTKYNKNTFFDILECCNEILSQINPCGQTINIVCENTGFKAGIRNHIEYGVLVIPILQNGIITHCFFDIEIDNNLKKIIIQLKYNIE